MIISIIVQINLTKQGHLSKLLINFTKGEGAPFSLSNLTRFQLRLVFHIKVLYVRKWRNLWNCFGWFWQRYNYNSDRKCKLIILILLSFLAMLNSKNPRFFCFCCVIEIESLFKVSKYILLIVWHFVVLGTFYFFIEFCCPHIFLFHAKH